MNISALFCTRGQNQKIVIRCKLYRNTSLSASAVEEFHTVTQLAHAQKCLLITTSTFDGAVWTAKERIPNLKLIDGDELHKALDMHFGKGLYRIEAGRGLRVRPSLLELSLQFRVCGRLAATAGQRVVFGGEAERLPASPDPTGKGR